MPCGPVNDMLQALADPQTHRARNGGRGRAFHARQRQDDWIADQVLADARQGAIGRAALRRAAQCHRRAPTVLTPTKLQRCARKARLPRPSLQRMKSADAKASETVKTKKTKSKDTRQDKRGGLDVSEADIRSDRLRSRQSRSRERQMPRGNQPSRSNSLQRQAPAAAPIILRARSRTSSPNTN